MNAMSRMPVLALNAGSSSLKFGLYLVDADGSRMLISGMVPTGVGHSGAFRVEDAKGNALACDARPVDTPQAAISRIAQLLVEHGLPAPEAIGHRIVHGGPNCRHHMLIDASVMQKLDTATAFAPLHVPPALALVRCAQERFPDIAQAACLDTAFHAGLPDVARTLPLPADLRARGIERYGFHGLSCESIVRQLGARMPRRLVIAHLGNGASVTAVADGRSIDTSMGLTPSGGVLMSSRCGDIDPGVLVYAVRELHYDAAQLESLIDKHSGMRGISGFSGDMRDLRAAVGNADAQMAIEMFCYSVRKQIGAMVAALGGIDMLVFTGGIGENDAATRASICEGLAGLGVGDARGTSVEDSSTHAIRDQRSGSAVRVMQAEEDAQIAHHTWQLTTQQSATSADHRFSA